MSIIQIERLTKTFRTRERAAGFKGSLSSFVAPKYRERQAVKPTSFALEAGEVLAFIGPNGAGKSTTIKMLTGILLYGPARTLVHFDATVFVVLLLQQGMTLIVAGLILTGLYTLVTRRVSINGG